MELKKRNDSLYIWHCNNEKHTNTIDNEFVSEHVSVVRLITHYALRRGANYTNYDSNIIDE